MSNKEDCFKLRQFLLVIKVLGHKGYMKRVDSRTVQNKGTQRGYTSKQLNIALLNVF